MLPSPRLPSIARLFLEPRIPMRPGMTRLDAIAPVSLPKNAGSGGRCSRTWKVLTTGHKLLTSLAAIRRSILVARLTTWLRMDTPHMGHLRRRRTQPICRHTPTMPVRHITHQPQPRAPLLHLAMIHEDRCQTGVVQYLLIDHQTDRNRIYRLPWTKQAGDIRMLCGQMTTCGCTMVNGHP